MTVKKFLAATTAAILLTLVPATAAFAEKEHGDHDEGAHCIIKVNLLGIRVCI